MSDVTKIEWTDHTFNPWWGCSRVSPACRFCLAPETRVLYADMTWRPIGDVRVGDELVGFTESPALGTNRLIERTVVEATWRTVAPTVELSVAGRTVVASANHKWLAGYRPWWRETETLHLDVPLRVLGDPSNELDITGPEYRAGYLAGVTAGDGTMRWDPSWRSDKLGFPQSYWRVAVNADDRAVLERLTAYLATFGVSVSIAPFDGGAGAKPMLKVETRRLDNLAVISGLLAAVGKDNFKAGWLAGIFDTDGSYTQASGVLRISQVKPNEVLDTVRAYSGDLGFKFNPTADAAHFVGDLDAKIRFLSRIAPALTRKCGGFYGQLMKAPVAPVTGIMRGPERELVDIQTSSRTFIAEGICTHNCYADRDARRYGHELWRRNGPRRMLSEANWQRPRKWNRAAELAGVPEKVFCASMADVFEDHPALEEPRKRLWGLIEATPWLRWQLLTKRPANVAGMVPWGEDWPSWVWLGVSAETQRWADTRIPILLEIPARTRFISAEPLLGPINLGFDHECGDPPHHPCPPMADWLIIGGESGGRARPMQLEWARGLLAQCRESEVSTVPFVKQLGATVGRELGAGPKGGDIEKWPADLRIREFPYERRMLWGSAWPAPAPAMKP